MSAAICSFALGGRSDRSERPRARRKRVYRLAGVHQVGRAGLLENSLPLMDRACLRWSNWNLAANFAALKRWSSHTAPGSWWSIYGPQLQSPPTEGP
eukprot:scaffold22738_cov31-Tisochrysis_lutea.AAC.8